MHFNVLFFYYHNDKADNIWNIVMVENKNKVQCFPEIQKKFFKKEACNYLKSLQFDWQPTPQSLRISFLEFSSVFCCMLFPSWQLMFISKLTLTLIQIILSWHVRSLGHGKHFKLSLAFYKTCTLNHIMTTTNYIVLPNVK